MQFCCPNKNVFFDYLPSLYDADTDHLEEPQVSAYTITSEAGVLERADFEFVRCPTNEEHVCYGRNTTFDPSATKVPKGYIAACDEQPETIEDGIQRINDLVLNTRGFHMEIGTLGAVRFWSSKDVLCDIPMLATDGVNEVQYGNIEWNADVKVLQKLCSSR
jgi:hypothetical protein